MENRKPGQKRRIRGHADKAALYGLLIALANKLSGEGKRPEEMGCAGCPLAANCSKLQEKEAGKK